MKLFKLNCKEGTEFERWIIFSWTLDEKVRIEYQKIKLLWKNTILGIKIQTAITEIILLGNQLKIRGISKLNTMDSVKKKNSFLQLPGRTSQSVSVQIDVGGSAPPFHDIQQ